jgi:hypothetical protein
MIPLLIAPTALGFWRFGKVLHPGRKRDLPLSVNQGHDRPREKRTPGRI